MTVLPVIARELRAAARQPFTYYLRLLGVAALLVVSLLFGLRNGFGATHGGALFSSLHSALFLAIWVLVPLLTADCLSRERREGTLGLLFLTPLRAGGIVVAKGLAQGLRAVTLWTAVLPVLTIPFLLGGVSWNQAVLSVLVNFSAICWALAAGLLASAWSRNWNRALLGSFLLAVVFALALAMSAGFFLFPAASPRGMPGRYNPNLLYALVAGGGFIANWLGVWPAYFPVGSGAQLIWAAGKLACLSLLVLAGAIALAGAITRRVWREDGPSQRQLRLRATFCQPILWVALLRRWMRWKLDHNPVGWLGQRTWSGRLVTWGWFAVVISLYSAVLTDRDFFRGHSAMQGTIAWFIAVTIGLSAAGSFQRERESGVLELLLVSPLGESAIIWGRLRGLWGQFLPAVALLLGIWWYFNRIFERSADGAVILFHAGAFVALPVIGLYFSLRCRGFMGALLSTLAVGLLAPFAVPLLLGFFARLYAAAYLPFIAYGGPVQVQSLLLDLLLRPYVLAAICQLALAAIFLRRLHRCLTQRNFHLEQARQ